jgi:hypothetical protein
MVIGKSAENGNARLLQTVDCRFEHLGKNAENHINKTLIFIK